jgi:hypothetical protein
MGRVVLATNRLFAPGPSRAPLAVAGPCDPGTRAPLLFGVLNACPALGALNARPALGALNECPVFGALNERPVLGTLNERPLPTPRKL